MTFTHSLIVAPAAHQDIRAALRATLRAWGRPQRERYEEQLAAAMDQLTRFPELGVRAEEFGPGLRGVRSGQHIIFCEIDDRVVQILRVLHVKMDAAAQFSAASSTSPPHPE